MELKHITLIMTHRVKNTRSPTSASQDVSFVWNSVIPTITPGSMPEKMVALDKSRVC